MIAKISRLGFNSRQIGALFPRNHYSYPNEVVETEYGPIRGVQKTSILGRKFFNFQGIPYMKAPVGKLRFRDAQSPVKWTEPLDATKEPPGYCMRQFLNYKDGGQEDAAVVNVYTPYMKTIKPLPVLVWIHGGGWNSGENFNKIFS
jgi:carboxylesterase type B